MEVVGGRVRTEAGWHPDPFGRHEYRYHDDDGWTEHVADGGESATDPPGRRRRLPRVAYVALALLVLAWVGVRPFSIEDRLPEVTEATFLELRAIVQTSGELIDTGRYRAPARSTASYDTKEDWLRDIHRYAGLADELTVLFAQGAQLYEERGAVDHQEFASIAEAAARRADEWAQELARRTPPERWDVEHDVFVEGLENIRFAAEGTIDCIEEGDRRCGRATIRMSDAFGRFGSVSGLLEWELRFEFDVDS